MDEPIAERVAAANPLSRMKVRERRRDKRDLCDGGPPPTGETWFGVTDQPTFAVAGFWQATAEGNGFTMVTCDPNEVVAPIHPKAMITILRPEDCDTWLRGNYDDVAALQRPYNASTMTVRGPVFPTREKSA